MDYYKDGAAEVMGKMWSCSSCVALLVGTVLPWQVLANLLPRMDSIHRVEKVYVTTQINGLRNRDSLVCPTGHTSCPASMNGGCCAEGYQCQTDTLCAAATG